MDFNGAQSTQITTQFAEQATQIPKDDSIKKLLKFGHTFSRNLDFIMNHISHTFLSTPTLLAQYI